MAPISCRHTLIWSLPTLAVLLTFLWYKSRRGSSRSDPGGTAKGTRKARKQEEKTTRVTSSLLAVGSEKSQKKIICSKSRGQTEIESCSPTTGAVILELGHPEQQQSEINIATKIIEKSTVENTVPLSRTKFSSDTSKIISVGKTNKNSFDVVEKCDNTDNKNSQIELSDTAKQSCVVDINSGSRPCAEENSVNVKELLAHCVLKESSFEVISSDNTKSATQKINSQETSSECGVLIGESSKTAVPKEISSEVVFPPGSDTGITVELESATEIVIYDTKEIKYEVTNLQATANERGLAKSVPKEIHSDITVPKEMLPEVSVHRETILEVAVPKETIPEVTVPKETIPEVTVPKETIPEVTVPKETIPKVVVPKETIIKVAVPKETISEVSVQKETIPEVAVQKETNSKVTVPTKTNSDIIVLQETLSEVTVPKTTVFEVLASQEINSDIAVAQELDCDIVATQEAAFEVTVIEVEDSKVVDTKETHSEITASQDNDPVTISETSHSNASKSGKDNLSISSLCSDYSRVSYSNTFDAGGEEVVSVPEYHSEEDLSSSSVLAVSSNSIDRDTEESTMPEPVKEDWTLEDSSDIQGDSASETQTKDTGLTCGDSNVCSQTEDSAAAQSARMETPPPVKEVSDQVDTAATSSNCGLEGKLAALELGKGRDSANHSPAEVMLASPSASSYSDEGSSDSGKGCSDLATPPSRTPASGSSVSGDATALSVYEFVLPQHLVGRLIGRHGAFVHQIKAKTNASILIKRHPDTQKLKICAVEGTQLDIESALDMIRKKFPLKHYPSITLEQVCFVPPAPVYPVLPECLQLMLVEGVSNDVILSSLVTPGHFFLQQPTHPTFPALNRLNACMNVCYSEPDVPLLPTPVDSGVICAAPTMGGWYRAQVVSVESETNMCEVKFVDYGGYLSLEHTALRQIRSDFMTLPFQASECFLANVIPAGGEEASWSADAAAVMEELTHGQVLQAQVCDYTEENVPNVFLYAVHCNQVVLVNQELVLRGLAEWWKTEEVNDISC